MMNLARTNQDLPTPPPFRYTLVKLAARCDIKCSYCYWFRDETVLAKPRILLKEAEDAFLDRLRYHVNAYRLRNFSLLFHGGEPLLFGISNFDRFCFRLRELEKDSGIKLRLSITTNGLLIDEAWVSSFARHAINVTLSIDGPPDLHDLRRKDFGGHGTSDRVLSALSLLREGSVEPGILAVCDPLSDPDAIYDYFVSKLGIKQFDILVPDATNDDSPLSIGSYYVRLFNLWLDKYSQRGVRVRYLDNIIRAVSGVGSTSESLGYAPITTMTLLTDGSLEPLDVLRIAGKGSTRTAVNVLTHQIQDVASDPVWLAAYRASLQLPQKCQECRFAIACGGGFLPSRYSKERGYDNPSVYCADLIQILSHAWTRLAPKIVVRRKTK